MTLERKHQKVTNETIIAECVAKGWTPIVKRMSSDEAAMRYYSYQLDEIKSWCEQQGMQHRTTYRILYRERRTYGTEQEWQHNNYIEYVWLFQNKHDAILWTLRWA